MLTLCMSAFVIDSKQRKETYLKNKTFVDLGGPGSAAEQVISLGYPAMLRINLNSFPDPSLMLMLPWSSARILEHF